MVEIFVMRYNENSCSFGFPFTTKEGIEKSSNRKKVRRITFQPIYSRKRKRSFTTYPN